jgi:isoquinoline 1-oxidoreductase beta subunit
MSKNKVNRRDFLKLVGSAGGGLVLALFLDSCSPPSKDGVTVTPNASTPTIESQPTLKDLPTVNPTETTPASELPLSTDWSPSIYFKVDHQGILTVTAFRSEMGQGIRTALAMMAAEELDVEWNNVRIEQAPADTKYGSQQTGGSVSVSQYYSPVRSAGATARQMLVNAAAQTWEVDAAQCKTESGFVIHPDGKQKLAYGDLVDAAAQFDLPVGVKTKDAAQFRILGTSIHHWDAPQIVTGKANYGLDVRLPGMLYAAIARCPVVSGGKFTNYDEAPALAIPGVKQVVALKDRVAVVAENSWAAMRGRDALDITWEEGKNASLSSEELFKAARGRLPQEGSAESGSIDAVYESPYEAHATMEPMNCTAHVHDGICEIWAPTQSPQDVQLAGYLATGLPTNVYVPLIGGGFGRRLQADYGEEAAAISMAINAPVQVVWTRADDLQHDFYHEMAVQYFNAPLDQRKIPRPRQVGGATVPTGAWRSVGEFTQAYGVQCFIDEMAAASNRDPLEYRLELYKSNSRGVGVMQLAAEKAGWNSPLPAGKGCGMAYHATFGVTHVCHVVEVSVDAGGKVRVERVVCAVDCGKVVNPDNVKAQMEGGIAWGLTAALKAEATFKNGRAEQSNFIDYPILRMDEMPVVEVHLVESEAKPSGIGEMGVPPTAPAVANAIFAATGKRVRHIPIRAEDLRG